jgi:hypothetical protein
MFYFFRLSIYNAVSEDFPYLIKQNKRTIYEEHNY